MLNISKLTQQVIEQSARILGECGTGDEITRMFQDIGVVDNSGESTKWRRINSVLWRAQQRDGNATRFIEFAQRMLAPVRYVGRGDSFKADIESLNQVICFDGLRYGEDGSFCRISPTTTLTEAERRANSLRVQLVNRNAHAEVLKYCTAELVANDAFHAIFEACKGIFERIRSLSGSALDGTRLIESMFGGTMPILALNTLQTQTERDEQSGLMFLLKGCASACRNPIAHEPRVLWAGSDEDALDSLVLISLLHKKLDRCVRTH